MPFVHIQQGIYTKGNMSLKDACSNLCSMMIAFYFLQALSCIYTSLTLMARKQSTSISYTELDGYSQASYRLIEITKKPLRFLITSIQVEGDKICVTCQGDSISYYRFNSETSKLEYCKRYLFVLNKGDKQY